MQFSRAAVHTHTVCVQRYLSTSSLRSQRALFDGGRGRHTSLCKQRMREGTALECSEAISDYNLLQFPLCVAEFAATSLENRDAAVHPHFCGAFGYFFGMV